MRTHSIMFRGWDPPLRASHITTSDDGIGQCRRSGDFASDLRCQQQQRRRALVNSVLEGADAGNMAQLVAAILTVLTVAWLLWQGPGAFVKRQIPCHRPKRRDSGGRALR